MSAAVGLPATAALLALNAFFVAAEFALVSARRATIEPRAEAGSARAVTTLRAMERVSLMLAGAQLGITLCSVALGALSEPTIAHLLEGPFAAIGLPESAVHPAAFAVALVLITVLHVVLGEMVPKNVALAAPDASALALSPVLGALVRIAKPLLWLLNGMANLVLRLGGVHARDEVVSAFTRDEIAQMVDESHREGLLDSGDRELLDGALAFESATATNLMLPLDRVHTLSADPTPADVETLAGRTGVTRLLLPDDDALRRGYVHVKDTLTLSPERRDSPLPESCIRALPTVAAHTSLADTIEVMRAEHAHIARVTADGDPGAPAQGVVTLDDVLARLVGASTR